MLYLYLFFFSSRRRHTRYWRDWSSDVCSSDLPPIPAPCHPQSRRRRVPAGGREGARGVARGSEAAGTESDEAYVNRLLEHAALVVLPRERQRGFAIRAQGKLDKRVPADAGAPDEVRRLTVTVRHAHIIDEISRDRVTGSVAEQPCGHRVLDQRPDVDHVAPAHARRDEDPGSADLDCHLSRTR